MAFPILADAGKTSREDQSYDVGNQVHSHFFSGVGEQHAVFWKLFPEYGKGAVAQVWAGSVFFLGGGWGGGFLGSDFF